ncbi:hypothetical protein HU200_013184 [Digitaria exilis]|uniref:Uncharacterized protein n=1 Tax=Digitaria exilis TaxID=1010633 RepID=A0A835KL88_9POAL|nr:hypothetical protein HU200_013184 [Digitaria exilis]
MWKRIRGISFIIIHLVKHAGFFFIFSGIPLWTNKL